MAEEPEGPDNLDVPPPFFPRELAGDAPDPAPTLVQCQVEGVYASDDEGSVKRYVVLTDGIRQLPIQIGPYEATAITLPLAGERPDRPMTHDLMKTIIERLGYSLEQVAIDDLWNGIFYAKARLRRGDETIDIDARPSDAIAMAIRFEVPILVSEEILATGSDGG